MNAIVLSHTWLRRIAICLLLAVCGASQAAIKIEYYIDSDPGIGNATQQTVSSSNVVLTIPTSGITPGVHTLSVRACDEKGNWSATVTDPLYIVEAVGFKRIEYYVDIDPGEGAGIPVEITSDPKVAFIIPTGNLNIGNHTLVVRGCDLNGNYSSIVETSFKVTGVEATTITLDPTETTMMEGESIALNASIAPENTSDKSVSWTSSDPNVAAVNEDGVVTALNAGTAIITATTSNGISATCSVVVESKIIDATEIYLDRSDITLLEGESDSLVASVYPENTTDKSVSWSSSDSNVATVSENGVVTAIKAGNAIITASTYNGITATCAVTVESATIFVERITIDEEVIEGEAGTEIQLTTTIYPENATNQKILWYSSNNQVAIVNEDGLVTVISEGSCIITATAADGAGAIARCQVTGLAGIEDMIIKEGKADIYTISGLLIKENADREFLLTLDKGVYILNISGKVYKIMVK